MQQPPGRGRPSGNSGVVNVNPADKRLSDLLEKWLTSLELHLKYSALDETAYRKVQPWPPHERPSRWIVELALQKVRQLREQHAARIDMGDVKFADALEQMGFLTNLVGSQHIRRIIPLAEPQSETAPSDQTTTAITPAATALEPADLHTGTTGARPAADDVTREMTQPKLSRSKSAAGKDARQADVPDSPAPGGDTREGVVVEDAKRLLGWGRKWHELPELISRMANRPSLTEVRRILREYKSSLQ